MIKTTKLIFNFLIKGLIFFILLLLALFLVFKTDWIKRQSTIPPEITTVTKKEIEIEKKKEEENLTDFQKFASKEYSKVVLFQDAITPRIIDKETVIKLTKKIKITEPITDGYLYIKAGVDSPLHSLTQYDSIYFYIDDGVNGGHIIRTKSLPIEETSGQITELLFPINEIILDPDLPYDENTPDSKVRKINLLKILQEPGDHFIGSFVSTLRYGVLLELTIGYKGGGIQTQY